MISHCFLKWTAVGLLLSAQVLLADESGSSEPVSKPDAVQLQMATAVGEAYVQLKRILEQKMRIDGKDFGEIYSRVLKLSPEKRNERIAILAHSFVTNIGMLEEKGSLLSRERINRAFRDAEAALIHALLMSYVIDKKDSELELERSSVLADLATLTGALAIFLSAIQHPSWPSVPLAATATLAPLYSLLMMKWGKSMFEKNAALDYADSAFMRFINIVAASNLKMSKLWKLHFYYGRSEGHAIDAASEYGLLLTELKQRLCESAMEPASAP